MSSEKTPEALLTFSFKTHLRNTNIKSKQVIDYIHYMNPLKKNTHTVVRQNNDECHFPYKDLRFFM